MNKEEFLRHLTSEVIEAGNMEAISTGFSETYTAHAGDKTYEGHQFIEDWTRQVHAAIHDIKVLSLDILSQQGDKVTWQRRMRGTHMAGLRGIPASERKVTWQEMVVSRFENDKIAEEWIVSELAGELLLKQPKK